jgi:hypothetical protein
MGLNYDGPLDRASFRKRAASSRLFLWLPPHDRPAILLRAAYYFSKRRAFFQDYFLFFWKVSTRKPPHAVFLNPSRKRSTP